jgi:hypothetical protein
MRIRPRDARFLLNELNLQIQLRQRLEQVASEGADLSADDADKLLEVCRQKLKSLEASRSDVQDGKPKQEFNDLRPLLLELIEKLTYS